jgi:hypothetical protein
MLRNRLKYPADQWLADMNNDTTIHGIPFTIEMSNALLGLCDGDLEVALDVLNDQRQASNLLRRD